MNEGKWAVITGASSGIGRALALEFAAGGFNVFLTGRDGAALAEAAREITAKHPVQTDIVTADLANLPEIDELVAAIESRPYRWEILVNNAGFGIQGPFVTTGIDRELAMLNVQLAAALKLTKAVLPGMISRHSGRILNVASVYSFAPVPFQSVYSACKSFLLSFSLAIRSEVLGTGVTVTVFCPGITKTEFRRRASITEKNKESGITASQAARVGYVETLRGTPVAVPGFWNRGFVFLSRVLPTATFASLVRYINRQRGQAHS